MDKAIGETLPKPALQEEMGREGEGSEKPRSQVGKRNLRQHQDKVGGQVKQHQAAGYAVEVGECKRRCSKPGHSLSQSKPMRELVPWGGLGKGLRADRISSRSRPSKTGRAASHEANSREMLRRKYLKAGQMVDAS